MREDSKRLKKFKDALIRELPFFPNDKETLTLLKNQPLSEVMIHYLHWKTRLVPSRPRKIHITPEVTADRRWKTLNKPISGLLKKVSNGEDLTPHLSLRAHRKGYTPLLRQKAKKTDHWQDKDFILNTKGFHHFHLDMKINNSGHAGRTNEVLFALVSRDSFHTVGIFDHSVFDMRDDGFMSDEYARMWQLHEKHISAGMEPGSVYISNPIMTSGHPLQLVRLSDYYLHIIEHIDRKLEDKFYVEQLYKNTKFPTPRKLNLEWNIMGLDLGLWDVQNSLFFNIQHGYL